MGEVYLRRRETLTQSLQMLRSAEEKISPSFPSNP
jgi:hypothetical protein